MSVHHIPGTDEPNTETSPLQKYAKAFHDLEFRIHDLDHWGELADRLSSTADTDHDRTTARRVVEHLAKLLRELRAEYDAV